MIRMRLPSALPLAPLAAVTLLACPRDAADEGPRAATSAAARREDPVAIVEAALPRYRDPASTPPQADPPEIETARTLIARREYEAARPVLRAILEERPEHGRATFWLAFTHHKEKRYSEARPTFERALAIGPTFEKAEAAFYMYGWCLWYTGEPAGAKAAFEATLELDPGERDAWFGLGLVAVDAADADEAERCFSRSIALAEAELARSEDDPRTAAQLKRDMAKAEAGLGDVALLRGDYDEARRRFEACVGQLPTAYEAWFKLHRVCARLGDTVAAEQALRMHREAKRRLGR